MAGHLAVVNTETGEIVNEKTPAHTPFEGRKVDLVSTQVTGSVHLDLHIGEEDVELGIDDLAHLEVTVRCSGVRHEVDKDGNLVRRQLVRVVEAELIPWDPSSDNGIVRGTV